MARKTFSKIKKHDHYIKQPEVVISLEVIDDYKEKLARRRDEGLLRRGTFRNRSTSLNILLENLFEVKGLDPENPEVDTIKINANDIYKAFQHYIQKRRPAKHTLEVYLESSRICLEEILFNYYGLQLSQTLGLEVFKPLFYLNKLSVSVIQEKGKQLNEYLKNEQKKVVTDERVKDAIRWTALLLQTKRESRTLENLRLALITLLLTGARSSELNDLQFEVLLKEEGRVLKQIDLNRRIIYFRRMKIKDSPVRSFTPVFIHPLLADELRIFKRKFITKPDEPIFGYYGLDKVFYRYYRPNLAFNENILEELYRKNPWLRKYPPNEPIITVSLIRKYVDSYLQERVFEMEGEKLSSELFGGGLLGLDNMRRFKNYLLGRVEGVDFYHYISITRDERFSSRYRRFTKMLFDGLIERLMPELLLILSPEVRKKLFGENGAQLDFKPAQIFEEVVS
ncbi:hypothetical protein [Thermococcus sp.]|uniref:hypothetical protein n=1 Tax=Thermococcus sp. TaxID=35749 RepID=UPI0025DB3B85|nr:hypothetical protein [Thermococcus sp.]